MKDYAAGRPGEEFFMNYGASRILFGQSAKDVRYRKKEGDFRLIESEAYVEIKTDRRCFSSSRPTGKIPIEIINPNNPEDKGWYYHAEVDDVEHIVFIAYRGQENKTPCCVVYVPYKELKTLVDGWLEDPAHKKDIRPTPDGTENLCIPLAVIRRIPGARIIDVVDDEEKARSIIAQLMGQEKD